MTSWLWNLKAKLYRSVRKSFPFNLILKSENKRLELLLCSLDIDGKKVVDLGTGTGNALQYLTDSNFVCGIDLTFSMLKVARQLYPGVELIQADALKLPVKTNAVEIVTAVGLSEYMRDIESLFKESYRLLKTNGYLIITFSPPGIWTGLRLLIGHSIFPRTLDELKKIAQNERFQLIENHRSLMQIQVLFQKI
jgi:ubiquinone/menaquinone biosynthesis C-methylase UbiE